MEESTIRLYGEVGIGCWETNRSGTLQSTCLVQAAAPRGRPTASAGVPLGWRRTERTSDELMRRSAAAADDVRLMCVRPLLDQHHLVEFTDCWCPPVTSTVLDSSAHTHTHTHQTGTLLKRFRDDALYKSTFYSLTYLLDDFFGAWPNLLCFYRASA